MRFSILVAGNAVDSLRAVRGDFDRFIRDAVGPDPNLRWSLHDLRNSAPLPRRDDADAFIITGSSSSVTERAPWMLRAEEFVRQIAFARVPLLGICFGHQLIAKAMGGEVERNPHGREIGTVRVERLADDPLFSGIPRSFDVHATHVDAVTRLAPEAEVLARTELDPVAAFRHGALRAVQFHPEFDGDVMRGYLHARADRIRAEGLDPQALLGQVHETTGGREVLRNFVGYAATRGDHFG